MKMDVRGGLDGQGVVAAGGDGGEGDIRLRRHGQVRVREGDVWVEGAIRVGLYE